MSTRPTPLTRDAFPVFRQIQTRWMDNDTYGHLNNTVHYSLFDTAVNSWLMENGMLEPYSGASIFLVVETGCSYFAEMRFPVVIHAGIRVASIGTSSICYEIGLFANDASETAAKGRFTHVHVDRNTRRPLPISDAMRAFLTR